MKNLALLLLATLSIDFASAQTTGHDHGTVQHMPSTASAAGTEAQAHTTGEVRRIDKANRKITLRHEAIENLDMPPMTMVFQVHDPALLDSVQPGDRVLFTAERINGVFVVKTLRRSPGK